MAVSGLPQTTVRLRAPAYRPSSRARAYWAVRALPGWVAIAAVETFVGVLGGPPSAVFVPVVVVTVVLGLAHLLVMPQWRYRVHRWEVTDVAVYTQSGWVQQERRIAPLGRIQTVDTARGPWEQLFGLANVTVTTASAKGPLVIDALDVATADATVALLTERAQLDTGDGT